MKKFKLQSNTIFASAFLHIFFLRMPVAYYYISKCWCLTSYRLEKGNLGSTYLQLIWYLTMAFGAWLRPMVRVPRGNSWQGQSRQAYTKFCCGAWLPWRLSNSVLQYKQGKPRMCKRRRVGIRVFIYNLNKWIFQSKEKVLKWFKKKFKLFSVR